LFYCDLNNQEYETLCKLKFNYPVLRNDDGDFLQLIKDTGFNIDLPLYKISLYKNDSLKSLKKQLSILRKLEEYNYPTNIAINFKSQDFNYNDILYIVREQSFIKSVVKIHNVDDISLKLLCAINIFNINFVCDTKKSYFDTKNIGYSADINNYRKIKLVDIMRDKLALTACKAAIKGGMDITRPEIDALFKMMDGDMTLKCPHGRPVVVKKSKKEFEKMFKMIV
jgi:hypothetical protein